MRRATKKTAATVWRFSLPQRSPAAWWASFGCSGGHRGAESVKPAAVAKTSSQRVKEPTCSAVLTDFSSLRTSSSFLLCFILSCASASHQQHTANRHSTSFMLSDLSCRFQVKRCFSEDLLEVQTVAPLTFLYVIPEETGKPLAHGWKAAQTDASD